MPAGAFVRIGQDIVAEARALSFRGPQARLAACASLGAVGAILSAFAFQLDNPWWAGISAVSILQAGRQATIARSLQRMAGTAIGAVIGVLLAPLVVWHIPFGIACAAIAGFTIYAQQRVEHDYAVLLCGVTAMLVLFGTLQSPAQALHLAVYRGLEVGDGILAGGLVSYLLQPAVEAAARGTRKPGIWSRPVDRELLGIALTAAAAVGTIPFIWTTFDLPSIGQTPITAFVVITALKTDPRLKASARLLGCCAGGAAGIVLMGVAGDAFLPWVIGLGAGLFIAGFLQHGGGDASYVGHQAAIALIMAMVTGPAASPELTPAIDRLVGIAGGIVVVSLATVLLAPLRRRLLSR